MLSSVALQRLIGEAASADSLQAVYQTALTCVQDVIGVERASLLAFDADGQMRFVAWSGLSKEYRVAVDGHSPWQPTEVNAQPLLVPDADADPAFAAYRTTFKREGIRALAFIPLRYGRRLLGKFMLYYELPHEFTEAEVTAAQLIADQVAFALEHYRLSVALEAQLESEQALRRQAELAAAKQQESESRLRLAMAAGHMGIWEWDIASDRVSWSAELESIHGLAPGSFDGTLEAFRSDVDPADAGRLEAAIAGALAHPEQDYAVEYRIIRPDGERRWVAARGRVVVDDNGAPGRMLGICSDVSELKRAEEARRFLAAVSRMLATTLEPAETVENLTRILAPGLSDWCVVRLFNDDAAVVSVEIAHRAGADAGPLRRLLEDAGRDAGSDHRGDSRQSLLTVLTSQHAVLVRQVADSMLETCADGTELSADLKALAIQSVVTVPLIARGYVLGTLSLLSDSQAALTERDLQFAEKIAGWAALAIDHAGLNRQARRAREAAEQSRGRLEALASVNDQIAISLDPDRALRELAERIVPAFGDFCVTYAVNGDRVESLGYGHVDSAKVSLVQRLATTVQVSLDDPVGPGRVIRLGEPCLEESLSVEQARVLAWEGQPGQDPIQALAPRSMLIVPLKARSRVLGAIALGATDDSGRRFGADDLSIVSELASRAALLVDNARLYAEATAAVRARDELMAIVSHDLRDPLQAIVAATDLLSRSNQGENLESLRTIGVASAQMQSLIEDLLDVTRIESGRLKIEKKRVDLGKLAERMRTLFQRQADARRVHLRCAVGSDVPAVMADGHRIGQVLSNLIGNALRSVEPGGEIVVGAEHIDGSVRLFVADDGCGIAEQDLDRIFDRFWRQDQAQGVGAGLGLTVAKGIIEAHGSTIEVESGLGAGSRFAFCLPACGVTAVEREARHSEDSSQHA